MLTTSLDANPDRRWSRIAESPKTFLPLLFDMLQAKLIKRGVPVKNLDVGDVKPGGGDVLRREVKLKMNLDSDTAKKVSAGSIFQVSISLSTKNGIAS